MSEDKDNENPEIIEPNVFSLAKPIDESNESFQDFESEPRSEIDNNNDNFQDFETILSTEVETIWSVSKSVSQKYDASIYQIMWGFYLENPNAFIDEDINRVRGDVDLALPSQELVASTSDFAAKESIAFINSRNIQARGSSIKPILKLTAPKETFNNSVTNKHQINSPTTQSKPAPMKRIDNSKLNASEIVSKNTSIIEFQSEADLSLKSTNQKNSQAFELKDLFWVGVLSLLLGFVIAYMFIRSSKKPVFTRAAVEEDLQDENNTFQTNLSISNDIETQELDLVRTYIAMGDWDNARKILEKLIANSTNDSIISDAQLLLKENK